MNKNHYKVIFSRVLNQLVVVSELAKTQGKATSENLEGAELKTTSNSTALFASAAYLLKPIHFSLMVALGFVYLAPSVAEANADMAIRADKSAPGHQQPTVLQTANGLPQVNIQTPSAAGVSRNQYSQFDVAEKGAILNNARKATSTQMAGWVQGNPNLARGEAKVILNEVNSANPSRLKGYVEVAGKKADVVIANPSGIHCEGCGVINAGRTTMTTGKAQLENGELKGYDVKGGKVTVSGKGMDNTQSDYTDIIAEKAQIDGGVWSKKGIKVTTGKNKVDRTNDSVVYVGDKNAAETNRTSPNPSDNQTDQTTQTYAVDVSQLGGMYAERIHLVDNGSGLGVRNAGHIGASAGNVQIDSQGRVLNQGLINGRDDIALRAKQDVKNTGKIESQQGKIEVQSKHLNQDGALITRKGDVSLKTAGDIRQTGETVAKGHITYDAKSISASKDSMIAAGIHSSEQNSHTIRTLDSATKDGSSLTLNAKDKVVAQGKNIAAGKVVIEGRETNLDHSQTLGYDVSVSSKQSDLNINHANVYATNALELSTPKWLSTQDGQLSADSITTKQHSLNNQEGFWIQRGDKDLSIQAEQLNNEKGGISTQGRFLINAYDLNNQQGQLVSRGEQQIQTSNLLNSDGKIISGDNQSIHTVQLDNRRGVISSQASQQIQVQKDIDNRQGRISGKDSQIIATSLNNSEQGLLLSSDHLNIRMSSELNNANGFINSTNNTVINAQALNNQAGIIYSNGGGDIHVANSLDNQNNGKIISLGNVSIWANNLDNREGIVQVAEQLSLTIPTIVNNKVEDEGSFIQAGKLTINADHVNNQGTIDKNGETIQQGISAKELTINTKSLDNSEGGIYVQKQANLNIDESLNNQNGEMLSWENSSISGKNLSINNDNGRLQAGNVLDINARSVTEDGHLEADKLRLTLQSDFNTKRDINAGTELSINTTGNVVNNNKLSAGERLTLNAQQVDNQENGRLSSAETRITATGKVTNRGLINSFSEDDNSKTVIKAGHIDNVGTGRIYGDRVALQADKIENRDERNVAGEAKSATIAARQRLDLAGKEIINDTTLYDADKKGGSTIYSGGKIEFGSHLNEDDKAEGKGGVFRNKSSIIEAEGDIALNHLEKSFNTNEHFSTEMVEYPDEGNKNEIEYVMIGTNGRDFNTGGKVKNDRFWHRRTPGKNKPGVYDLVWKTDLDRKLTNDELDAGYIPQANQNVCSKSDPSLCYVKPTTVYGGDYGIWKRFDLEVPKDAPTLDNLPTVRAEPTKPRPLTKWQAKSAKRKARYDEAMSRYETEMAAYKEEVAQYNDAIKPYTDWVNNNADAFTELNQRIKANNDSLPDHYRNRWTMQVKEEKVLRTTVKTSLPGQILAGGDIDLGDSYLENDKSTIISGGLINKETGELKNLDKKGIESHQLYGTAKWVNPRWRGNRKGWRWYGDNYDEVIKRREENTSFDMNIFTELSHTEKNGAQNPFYVDQSDHRVKQGNAVELNQLGQLNTQSVGKPSSLQNIESLINNHVEIRTMQPDTRLPTQSLYKINPAAEGSVLIETDPEFTNKNRWLSSDYMFKALRNDPQNMLKRLGDGYYEQRLVREQMNRLTGRHFTGNNRTFEEQYKALMDAGVTFAQKFNLSVGVSLTPAQVAQLTSDIVWMEKQTVTLPSGKVVEALVPRVYAVVKKGDLDGNGTLISGERVYVKGSEFENQGTIAGKTFAKIDTESLKNSGKLTGGVLSATVAGNLDNIGGVLDADKALILNVGGDFNHRSTTQSNEIKGNGLTRTETNLDRKALLHVKGEDGVLSVSANNIHLEGSEVLNEGRGLTLLDAKNNLNLTALSVGYDEKLGKANSYRNEKIEKAVVSSVKGKGDITLTGKNILSEGAELESDARLMAIAENNLVLNGAKESQDLEEFHKTKSGSVAKVTKTSFDKQQSETQRGTQVSGKEVVLAAGHDVKGKGLQAIAENDLLIQAGHDVDIAADTNHFKNIHKETKKTSGVFTSGGGITFGSKSEKHHLESEGWTQSDARSTLGSMNGNIKIQAGNHANVLGTDMITPRTNRIDIEGASVKVEAGKDIINTSERHEYKQSGLTLAVSTPVTDMAQAAYNSVKRSQQVTNPKLKALYHIKAAEEVAMAAQNVGKVAETLDALRAGNMQGTGTTSSPSIKVSVSYGNQKQTQTSESQSISHQKSTLSTGTLNVKARDEKLTFEGVDANAKLMALSGKKALRLKV